MTKYYYVKETIVGNSPALIFLKVTDKTIKEYYKLSGTKPYCMGNYSLMDLCPSQGLEELKDIVNGDYQRIAKEYVLEY